LAGGSASQRTAVKQVFTFIRELDVEIVDLGEAQPVTVGDPKIALLALLLDPVQQAHWHAILQLPHTSAPPPLMVALLADRSSELILAALRAGADDVLSLPPAPDDALRALLRAGEVRRRVERPDKKNICALVSMSGGRGISSLTVCLGFAVQRLLEKRAALVDLDLQAAPLSVLLDVAP